VPSDDDDDDDDDDDIPHPFVSNDKYEVPPNQCAAIPFSVGKNLIKKQLEQRHQCRCTGYRQSKVLMTYLLPSRASELLAMNKSRLRTAVGLLTGHTSVRAHLYKLGYTEGQ
jgi:hypothetical protein